MGSRYWSTFLASLSEKGQKNFEVPPGFLEDFESDCEDRGDICDDLEGFVSVGFVPVDVVPADDVWEDFIFVESTPVDVVPVDLWSFVKSDGAIYILFYITVSSFN